MIRFASGTGASFGKAKNQTLTWKQFKALFERPLTTSERLKDYLKLPDTEQIHLKAVNGWVYRTQVVIGDRGMRRNRNSGMPSDLITLDFDYASPEFFDDIINGRIETEFEYFIHTSRRHTPEKPRFRMFIPVNKAIPNDIYPAVSRIFARKIDPAMEFVDKVSFRPAQMMFKPTCSKDGEFVFWDNQGELLDWSEMLDVFEATEADWRNLDNLPKVPGEHLRESAEKAEVPTDKLGVVGDFCRAYDIHEAIATFLPDKYAPSDDMGGKARYTYLLGTTTNGAEVQDDGLFLYSHHGSDPCADMLVNAFDLVRIHLYGDKDKEDDFDKPITKRPSYLAMVEAIQNDDRYRAQVVKSRYDMDAMEEDFTDDMVEVEYVDEPDDLDSDEEDEIEALVGKPAKAIKRDTEGAPISPVKAKRKRRPPPPEGWVSTLDMTLDGNIISNAPNIAQIIQNDPRLRNCVEYNEFMGRVVSREPIKTRLSYVAQAVVRDPINGTPLEDRNYFAIKMILQAPNGPGKPGYGLRTVTDADLYGAVDNAAATCSFNPIVEFLRSGKHDGVARAESMFIEYCGCPDTPYYREAALKFLLGAVTRAFEPGAKFDFAPIFAGAQGKRKSTMIKILAKSWYGELKADFSNEARLIESMQNCWIMEMPELSSIGRSRIEDIKAFISATFSTARLAWARTPKVFPRQCVFVGSTNDDQYLIDATGNRRWWPIPVEVDQIDTDKLAAQVDQIWWEVVAIYDRMRADQPVGDLPLYLTHPESIEESNRLQEAARIQTEADGYAELIHDWLDKLVPPAGFDDFDDAMGSPKMQHRRRVTVMEIWKEAMNMGDKHTITDSRAITKALKVNGWVASGSAGKDKNRKSFKYFVPRPEVLARWQAEEEGDDLI
ncbi:MAG: virulence-associated E family protein [Phreatobacter sp.]|nr:virulence-associated E family protein [Phreatobacter sp.]